MRESIKSGQMSVADLPKAPSSKQISVHGSPLSNKSRSKKAKKQSKLMSINSDEEPQSTIAINEPEFDKFNLKPHIDVPPQQRTFNEHDILGDFDTDDKGNLILLSNDNGYHDK